MEPGPSGVVTVAVAGPSTAIRHVPIIPEGGQVQQTIMNPIPGPSHRPYLATPVQVPPHFLVPEEQLLPHQVRSGIDIGNLFKILNALQNRIALACGQHQYMKDPLHHPRPPEDGGYKPLTTQAAVRDIRSLCRQQRNLMEKLRRWNCINEGKCYDLIMNNTYTGICKTCEPFAVARQKSKLAGRTLRKQKLKVKCNALRRQAAAVLPSTSAAAAAAMSAAQSTSTSCKRIMQRSKMAIPAPPQRQQHLPSPAPLPPPPPPPPVQSPKKKRKLTSHPPEPLFPDEFMTQEDFLNALGLVTPEVKDRINAESKRTERRRRTTANPKYKSSSFVDSSQIGRAKRSRRGEPEETVEVPPVNVYSSPARLTGAERRKLMQRRYECTICGEKDVTVKCDNCLSGFHTNCIRVSGSRAATPETVSVCPNCVPSNPDISASDCILFSRKMYKPSIMGKSEAAQQRPRGSGNARVRRQAATKRRGRQRKPTAAATKAKPKRQSFKKPPPKTKPKAVARSTSQRGRKLTVPPEGTLNRSSAVAAADAIPAYYSSSSSSTAAKKRRGGNQSQSQSKEEVPVPAPAPRGRPPAKSNPPPRSQQNKTRAREKAPQSQNLSLAEVTKKMVTGSATSHTFTNGELTITTSDADVNFPKKSPSSSSTTSDNVTITITTEEDDCYTYYSETFSENEENATIENYKSGGGKAQGKTAAGATSTKPAPNMKKPNDPQKPRPVNPLCMKRTMMAMSAAAGIVLSSGKSRSTQLPVSPTTEARLSSIVSNSKMAMASTKTEVGATVISPNKTLAAATSQLKKVTDEVSNSLKSSSHQVSTVQVKPSTITTLAPSAAAKKIPPRTLNGLTGGNKQIIRTKQITPKTNGPTLTGVMRNQKLGHKPNFSTTSVVATKLFPEPPVKQVSEEKKAGGDKKKPAATAITPALKNMAEKKIEKTIEAVIRDAMAVTTTTKAGNINARTAANAITTTVAGKFGNSRVGNVAVAKNNGKAQNQKASATGKSFATSTTTSATSSKTNGRSLGMPVLSKYTTATPAPAKSNAKKEDEFAVTTTPFAGTAVGQSSLLLSSNGSTSTNTNITRCPSPTSSTSSTIGSSRSINDDDDDDTDSSEGLLSIPDTPYYPTTYYGVRREDSPTGPLSTLSALDRIELLNRKTSTPTVSPTFIPRNLSGGWIPQVPN